MKHTIKKHIKTSNVLLFLSVVFVSCSHKPNYPDHLFISGIYPHLAYYNNHAECGTGAVVPWADRLWVITYGQHFPFGSSDRLYEITPDMQQIVRPESVGGTPANRMIHKETNQLFIGPYIIDSARNVRVLNPTEVPGRHTGVARHLFDPESKMYLATMEEGFYEVDMKTLETKTLYVDGNVLADEGKIPFRQSNPLLPGSHGKGLYTGQGVLVFSNNGEVSKESKERFDIVAGSLSEWDGRNWKVVRRNQFTEVTGPGGICGNDNPDTDPIWAVGWDHRSLLLGVRGYGTWSFYRLPKASNSYDGAHGWNTEWPRIRNIAPDGNEPAYLMTMHGMFWSFPGNFTAASTSGIRPLSSYLKVIGDFARWNDKLVFGCDDSAQKEFLNTRSIKGGIEGAGQSNSNLWFVNPDQLTALGRTNVAGSVFMHDTLKAGQVSDAYLFAGWKYRCAWIHNKGNQSVRYTFEVDKSGNNEWTEIHTVQLVAGASAGIPFAETVPGEWIRVRIDQKTISTVSFVYAPEEMRNNKSDNKFTGLATVDDKKSKVGLLYGLPDNRRRMSILAAERDQNMLVNEAFYEIDSALQVNKTIDKTTEEYIRKKLTLPKDVISVEKGSVLIVDDKGRKWRLPKGNEKHTDLIDRGLSRLCREVVTERDLLNCHGTFYELPAENADGFAKIKPIASHNFAIYDFASYRGLMLLSGVKSNVKPDGKHIFGDADKKAVFWAGVIDDLWEMGKPVGSGGPWMDEIVNKNCVSDPYLIGHYDQRIMTLSHKDMIDVTFRVEVDPTGDGNWMHYRTFAVQAGEKITHTFPKEIQMRWIRFSVDKPCRATAWLEYK